MADTHRAPKQWCLTKNEDINSFDRWRQNLLYTLTLDEKFTDFLNEGEEWGKKTKSNPTRGFTDDGSIVPKKKTAKQKVIILEMMLGQIANFCPVIARNTIIHHCTSLNNIWQTIRLHYGFQSSGAHFLDLADIHMEADERPEDLYQRLISFFDDNLLCKNDKIHHHGVPPADDEEITPTVENFIVLLWLQLIHKDLPKTVQQRYGTELREKTLASIKPEISKSLNHMLTLIRSSEDARVLRTATDQTRFSRSRFAPKSTTRRTPVCPLCKQAGRADMHFLSNCKYLPETDKRYITKARQIVDIMSEGDVEDEDEYEDEEPQGDHKAFRIQVRQSPYLDTFYGHSHIRIVIDSGATGNMIRANTASRLGVKVVESTQSAHQADGASPLDVVGETRFIVTNGNRQFQFEGLVVENLDVDILGGTPFMEVNDISIRPAKRSIIFSDGETYIYGSPSKGSTHHIRRAHVVRGPATNTTVWPGEYIEVSLPDSYPDNEYALEPRIETSFTFIGSETWPKPSVVHSIAGKVRIPNLTDEPLTLKRHSHFCQVVSLTEPLDVDDKDGNINVAPVEVKNHDSNFSKDVQIDPDNMLPPNMKEAFSKLTEKYDHVFDPKFKGYNGYSGKFEAVINMGPVQPPQRKGRVPQYAKDKLQELQQQFDQLESLGVFKKPEDIGISVEYLNPSFLVKKSSGGHRLVTAFADVGRYSKPQPALMPDVDSTLRLIAQWQYIITTDLSKAFYQIPLSRESLKYCGVATPFRGVRVYVRSAMGMPGSEVALEELMCRIFGDLLHEGAIAKTTDDFYCGGNSLEELFNNWHRVLDLLEKNGLCVSAAKTIVCPKSTVVLGWLWKNGSLQATQHKIVSLATCSLPGKVTDMRSFIGAYKVLARVLPNCASYIIPLDCCISGKQSKDIIEWTDSLKEAFSNAQIALKNTKAIVLPREGDQLFIVTDGSVKKQGIGATLYARRRGVLKLAGFFSAKLRDRQVLWLPCEVEALAIAIATKHFAPYIVQSKTLTTVLTDSKPCVQAYEKLCRGEFSASPRVSTFLSVVSRYQASVRHIAGVSNLPSDHASRNAVECNNEKCQVCSFVTRTENSVVRNTSIQDIVQGKARLPYTSRSTWLSLQADCKDLRRAKAHLKQGTRPSKKLTNVCDVKRYLQVTTLARDGLVVVKRSQDLAPDRECIVIPRQVAHGVLQALHIQLDHPTEYQFKQVVTRFFYALDLDKILHSITKSCHLCCSLASIPRHVVEQSTSEPTPTIGSTFAADVMRRERQFIFVMRECITSFTLSCHIEDEKHDTLRDIIIKLVLEYQPLDGPPVLVRVDPAPGFRALYNDDELKRLRIDIDLGRVKNPNKNPVAEKAIRELREEIIRIAPRGEPISTKQLAVATAQLNRRIRSRGLSAREMLLQRDQYSNDQIPLRDYELILKQNQQRKKNHSYSEHSKAPSGIRAEEFDIEEGSIVYLYGDRNKNHTRNRYLVTKIDSEWCYIKKFIGAQLRNTSYRVKRSECFKVHDSIPSMADVGEEESEEDIQDDNLPSTTDISPMSDLRVENTVEQLSSSSPVIEHAEQIDSVMDVDQLPCETPLPCEIVDPVESSEEYDIVSKPQDSVQKLDSARRSTRIKQRPEYLGDYVCS